MDISEPVARSVISAPVAIDAREPAPVPAVEQRERRYPRRVHYEFYEKREPAAAAALEARAPEPEPVVIIEERAAAARRFPRRAPARAVQPRTPRRR